MTAHERQFARLTRLVLDGVATDSERAELDRLSAAHPELVGGIVDELIVDAFLKWQSGSINEELPFLMTGGAIQQEPMPNAKRRTMPIWSWMIAAMVVVAAGLAALRIVGPTVVDPAIADIVYQQGVEWSDDCTALDANYAVRPGRLSTASGEYTLQFRNGSTVRVEGRASLDIKSKMLVQLEHGRATADVPPNSTGFTITSELIDVVDLGTQFGISVNQGKADVIVFDGKVDLQSKVGNRDVPTRLTQGECIQVDQLGKVSRLADVRRDVEGRWWTDDRDSKEHVIARVYDNIHAGGGGKTFACFQTTFDGLHEDALAYSDNPHHQWNGLTPDGLPAFLKGADYIRTFNDYRYLEDYQIMVELVRPANLYVFFDDRVETPSWLAEGFEDTGIDIGIDEGPWLLEEDELKGIDLQKFREWDVNTTAAGGGNSIDNVFSVWRRRCVEGGVVTLGNAGSWGVDRKGLTGKGGRAMYGIAATPLDVERTPAEILGSSDGS